MSFFCYYPFDAQLEKKLQISQTLLYTFFVATFWVELHLIITVMQPELSLEALIAGDRAEFARLVDAYSSPIYRLGLRMLGNPQDAEDVLQVLDLPADRALRHQQLVGRLGEGERAGHRLERAQGIERRQAAAGGWRGHSCGRSSELRGIRDQVSGIRRDYTAFPDV